MAGRAVGAAIFDVKIGRPWRKAPCEDAGRPWSDRRDGSGRCGTPAQLNGGSVSGPLDRAGRSASGSAADDLCQLRAERKEVLSEKASAGPASAPPPKLPSASSGRNCAGRIWAREGTLMGKGTPSYRACRLPLPYRGIKVGVTRSTQVPVRWIDQGAVMAVVIARTPVPPAGRSDRGRAEEELRGQDQLAGDAHACRSRHGRPECGTRRAIAALDL
jgi:hypothetical protein